MPLEDEALLEPGTRLGRYVIVRRLGAGGMSLVYEAHDAELDRRLAIKVMRSRYWDAAGQARALREGQAMAKLSHPNVVSVFDVGAIGDQTFIAMELVDGITLKEWLRAPRGWRAILDALVQAGRGIAAAHAAQLVHRDVKPGNVLIDRGGRARVTDFGIARPSRDSDTATTEDDVPPTVPDEASDVSGSRSLLDAAITRTGAVVGTPAYMAPEQREGRVGFRADQYSFCLMAREALGAEAPRWLRRAIARGLSVDPAARYPSMDALLAAMTADPTARRLRIAAAVAGVALVGATVAAIATRSPAASPCGGAEELAEAAWNDDLAADVERAFAATGRSHAAATFARVDGLLVARRDAWAARRRDVCEATRVRGEQSERLLDLRIACLDRRLAELQALTTVLATRADGEVVDHAIQAVRAQADLAVCDDVATLEQAVPPPADPAARAEIDRLGARIDEVAALSHAGKYGDALAAATAVAADAERAGWAPAHARALFWLGRLQSYDGQSEASEATLERAMARAADAGDDALAAEAGLELIYVLGYELARPDEALQTADLVTALVRRAGTDPMREAELLDRIGVVLWAKQAFPEAQAKFEAALARFAALPDGQDFAAATLTNLGNVLADQGEYEAAERRYREELAITERTVGADHPQAARGLANLGTVLSSLGRGDEARRAYERALAIWESAYGSEHPMIAMVTNNLGELVRERDPQAALAYCERARAIGEATLPDGHPIRAHHLLCVGHALLAQGRAAEAATAYEGALAIRSAAGSAPAELAEVQLGLAKARWSSGERRAARALASAARDGYRAAGAPYAEVVTEIDAWLRDHR